MLFVRKNSKKHVEPKPQLHNFRPKLITNAEMIILNAQYLLMVNISKLQRNQNIN